MTYAALSDEELMAGAQAGDHGAFEELVTRHAERYYRLAYRYLFDRQDAEDMVQEAFLKLWDRKKLWRAKKGVKFTTWFYRIVVNACYDHSRKQQSSEQFRTVERDCFPVYEDWQEERTDDTDARRNLREAMQLLPDRQRMAINLCFQEGLSNKEAAEAMGIRLKALQSLIMRGKQTLKGQLLKENGSD